MRWYALALVLWPFPGCSAELTDKQAASLVDADVVLIGEIHDNPKHHAFQAETVARLQPAALVFEMLSERQASMVSPSMIADSAVMEAALQWEASGWPDFAMYHPIFAAAADADYFGAAVPGDAFQSFMQGGPTAIMGEDAGHFGLLSALPEAEQTRREALQMEAHCNAMPEDALPVMVGFQRLRDARLAQATLEALDETGGPVVVITGNGHARTDWGVPWYLNRVRPALVVHAIGQAEEGVISGTFDMVVNAPSVDRPDPCAAFENRG